MDMQNQCVINQIVRGYLTENKYTQDWLAKSLGRSAPYVGRRLNNKTAWDTNDIDNLAAIGVPVVVRPECIRGLEPENPYKLNNGVEL